MFMNQGEWELLHVLSKYKNFSVDSNEYYAEMKFHVSNIVFYSLDSKTIKLQETTALALYYELFLSTNVLVI